MPFTGCDVKPQFEATGIAFKITPLNKVISGWISFINYGKIIIILCDI